MIHANTPDPSGLTCSYCLNSPGACADSPTPEAVAEALDASYAQAEKVKARLDQACFNREDLPADLAMMFHAEVEIMWASLERHAAAARDWLRIQENTDTIRWCEVHKQGMMRGQCGPNVFYKEPCRMVERKLI
jgi:hypothetical protein